MSSFQDLQFGLADPMDLDKESGTQPRTLLLVDDDSDQLLILEHILRKGEYNVITSTSAEAALEILNSQKVDLLISDVMMPEINGPELVETVRGNPKLENLPIIVLTSGRQDLEMDLLVVGADIFCSKSEAKDTLLTQVGLLL